MCGLKNIKIIFALTFSIISHLPPPNPQSLCLSLFPNPQTLCLSLSLNPQSLCLSLIPQSLCIFIFFFFDSSKGTRKRDDDDDEEEEEDPLSQIPHLSP